MSQELVNLGAATRSQRPSFFELLAAERLTAAVQAAISYSLGESRCCLFAPDDLPCGNC